MKNLRTAAVIAVALIVSACTTKENTNTNTTTTPTPSNGFNRTYSIQGYVADATTGARIGGSDLQLFLIEGATVASPARLNSGATDALLGEFAFTNIPLDLMGGNKTYKIVAVKPGFQRFESEISHVAVTTLLGDPANAFDTVYNYIGNIYMFPLGATAPDYEFTVTYNGKPVPGATVLLDPVPEDNVATTNQGHALGAASSFLASLTGTTNASGVVTFAGANLVLGGAYTVQILPVDFTDTAGTVVPLARYINATNVVVGVSNYVQRAVMSDLVPSNLYITRVSTLPEGQISATGTLEITFSAPVTLHLNGTGFSAALAGTATGALGTPGANAEIVSPTVIRLTPNYTTQLAAGDQGVTVTYGNGTAFVTANDYPGYDYNVFDLLFADGTAMTTHATVQIRGWAVP
jgi:hypothetical protein